MCLCFFHFNQIPIRLIKINTMTKTEFNNVYFDGTQICIELSKWVLYIMYLAWTKSNLFIPKLYVSIYQWPQFIMNGRLPTFLLLILMVFQFYCCLFTFISYLVQHTLHIPTIEVYSTWRSIEHCHMICMWPFALLCDEQINDKL